MVKVTRQCATCKRMDYDGNKFCPTCGDRLAPRAPDARRCAAVAATSAILSVTAAPAVAAHTPHVKRVHPALKTRLKTR